MRLNSLFVLITKYCSIFQGLPIYSQVEGLATKLAGNMSKLLEFRCRTVSLRCQAEIENYVR
jgi:hypothetical protein